MITISGSQRSTGPMLHWQFGTLSQSEVSVKGTTKWSAASLDPLLSPSNSHPLQWHAVSSLLTREKTQITLYKMLLRSKHLTNKYCSFTITSPHQVTIMRFLHGKDFDILWRSTDRTWYLVEISLASSSAADQMCQLPTCTWVSWP